MGFNIDTGKRFFVGEALRMSARGGHPKRICLFFACFGNSFSMEVQGRECKELLSVAVSFLFQLMKHKFWFAGEFNAFICGMGLHRLDVTNYPIKPFYLSEKVRFRFGCRRVPSKALRVPRR